MTVIELIELLSEMPTDKTISIKVGDIYFFDLSVGMDSIVLPVKKGSPSPWREKTMGICTIQFTPAK